MIEWKLKSKTDSMIIFEQKQSDECYNTAYFDLLSKTLHVTLTEFVRHTDNGFIPMDNTRHSAKYGHWKTAPAYLGLTDIRFLAMLAEHYLVKAGGRDES